MISIDVSSDAHLNKVQMKSPSSEPMINTDHSFFGIGADEGEEPLCSLPQVTQQDNAKACLYAMRTSDYMEAIDQISQHDLVDFKKATAFDLFQKSISQHEAPTPIITTKQNSLTEMMKTAPHGISSDLLVQMSNSSPFLEHMKNQAAKQNFTSSPLVDLAKNKMMQMQKTHSSPFVLDKSNVHVIQKSQNPASDVPVPKQPQDQKSPQRSEMKEPRSPINRISRKQQFMNKHSALYKMFRLESLIPDRKYVTLKIQKKAAQKEELAAADLSENYMSETSSESAASGHSSDKDIYEKQYGMYKIKHIQIGKKYQVDRENVPLLIDLLENPEITEHDQKENHDIKIQENMQVWNPNILSPKLIDYYLIQMKKLWPPRNQYFYQEDIALQFLHMKNYKIEDAIISAIFDKDQLIELIQHHQRQRIDTSKMLMERHVFNYRLMTQNQDMLNNNYGLILKIRRWIEKTFEFKSPSKGLGKRSKPENSQNYKENQKVQKKQKI